MPSSKQRRMLTGYDRTYDRRLEEVIKSDGTWKSLEKINQKYDRAIYGDPKPVVKPPQFAEPDRVRKIDSKRGKEVDIRLVHERDPINQRFRSRKV